MSARSRMLAALENLPPVVPTSVDDCQSIDVTIAEAIEVGDQLQEQSEAQGEIADVAAGLEDICLMVSEEGFAENDNGRTARYIALSVRNTLRTYGIENMILHPSNEAFSTQTPDEVRASLEDVITKLDTGMEGIGNDIAKSIGDWWAHSDNALVKLSAQANLLRNEIRKINGTPTKETIKISDADTLQYNGNLDLASIAKGYTSLTALSAEMNKAFEKVAKDYFTGYLEVMKETADIWDAVIQDYPKFAGFYNLIVFTLTAGPIAGLMAGGIGYVGGLLNRYIANLLPHLGPERRDELSKLAMKASGIWETVVNDIEKIFGGQIAISGGKTFKFSGGKSVDVEFVKTGKSSIGSSEEIKTPALKEIDNLLIHVIDSAKNFRTAKTSSEHLEKEAETAIRTVKADKGDKAAFQVKALERGAIKIRRLTRSAMIVPMVKIGKEHLSVTRSIIALAEKTIAAYK